MLIPGDVPTTEPLLRVGIVLPEDKAAEIELYVPPGGRYDISADEADAKPTDESHYHFRATPNGIQSAFAAQPSQKWHIDDRSNRDIGGKSGIRVKNVVAGRGFHWQKNIDVYLAGSIEIQMIDGFLTLVNILPLEHYLMCVATSEMGSACPPGLIEAQTIVARSWMLANVEQKHIALGMDVCNDDCCQRYQGTNNLDENSIKGAQDTSGLVLLHAGKICDARYSKSCGGITEEFSTIWSGSDLSYLKSVPDCDESFEHRPYPLRNEEDARAWIDSAPACFCSPQFVPEETLIRYLGSVDESGEYFRWQKRYSQAELVALLNARLGIKASSIEAFRPCSRGKSGRITDLEITYRTVNGSTESRIVNRDFAIRQALHEGFLYSSCLYFEMDPKKNNITIHGAGWGHGVGLCQIGALGMSLRGYNAQQITAHYYPGSVLKKIY